MAFLSSFNDRLHGIDSNVLLVLRLTNAARNTIIVVDTFVLVSFSPCFLCNKPIEMSFSGWRRFFPIVVPNKCPEWRPSGRCIRLCLLSLKVHTANFFRVEGIDLVLMGN